MVEKHTSKQVADRLGITLARLRGWFVEFNKDEYGPFIPSIQPGYGSGTTALYSVDDILSLQIFKYLIDDVNIVRRRAAHLVSACRSILKRQNQTFEDIDYIYIKFGEDTSTSADPKHHNTPRILNIDFGDVEDDRINIKSLFERRGNNQSWNEVLIISLEKLKINI